MGDGSTAGADSGTPWEFITCDCGCLACWYTPYRVCRLLLTLGMVEGPDRRSFHDPGPPLPTPEPVLRWGG